MGSRTERRGRRGKEREREMVTVDQLIQSRMEKGERGRAKTREREMVTVDQYVG